MVIIQQTFNLVAFNHVRKGAKVTLVTVLITGCGGAIGLGLAKALRTGSKELHFIGADSDLYAAFFHLKRKRRLFSNTYTLPMADQPDYTQKIIDICRRERVDVILPGTDAELEKLSALKNKIAKIGTKIIISNPKTIKTCRDKWLTYRNLSACLPIVKSALPEIGIEKALKITGLPAIIKPRLGWGSRQTYKVESAEKARIIMKSVEKPVIQTYLEGDEYTVDGLANSHGKALCIVPRRRIKVFAGLSFQGITVRDRQLIELGKKITHHLRIVGPFNFQAKKIDGKPTIIEINPRFAGTGILSVKAGVNIPFLALREICNMKIPNNIDFKEGVVMSRYFEEVFFNS